MTIEILRCPVEEAMMYCSRLDEGRFVMPYKSWAWLSWLQGQAPKKTRLGVVQNGEDNTFSFGCWVYTKDEMTTPLFHELRAFSADPSKLWPSDLPDPGVMASFMRPVEDRVGVFKRRAAAKASDERLKKEQDLCQRNDAVKYLRNRGYLQEAELLNTGAVPFVGKARSQDDGSLVESLNEMARRS